MKSDRLAEALKDSAKKRAERVAAKKTRLTREDLPLERRKLTQQEAAAYCGVSLHTFREWEAAGLRSVPYGKRRRYMVEHLQAYMIKIRKRKGGV